MAYGYVGSDSELNVKPEYLGRKGEGIMDEDDFNHIVQEALAQSVQFIDTELSPERARATEYYLGKPFGNEEEGRSQMILTELRDAVNGVIPSLLRVFFGSDHTVEFVPTSAQAVEDAAQATDYIRYVFEQDNAGFLNTLAVLKDGLVRKIGIFKWGWDERDEPKAYRLDGVTRQELDVLAADDDIDLKIAKPVPTSKEEKAAYENAMQQYAQALAQSKAQPGAPPPQKPQPPEQRYDVQLTRIIKGGRMKVWTIPPEEFIFNREARTIEDALIVAHRTDKTRGELIAMGYDEDTIDEHASVGGGTDVTLKANAEEIARRDVAGIGRLVGYGYTTDPEMGRANDKILYCEAFMRMDYDGDGVPELRRICTIGPSYYPVMNEPVSEANFAIFTPDPEPHTLLGGSWADRLMDMQKFDSSILRGVADSLSMSIFPRMAVVEGQVNMADAMNTAVGAPLRMRVPGAAQSFAHDFVGEKAMPLLQFAQEIIERRTGQAQGVGTLDSDALQSTDKQGVEAAINSSQAQAEMLARIFAEGTLKPLFRGMLRMFVEHQPRPRVIRLRGKWTEVDPRSWDANMDMTVNVALGTTFVDRKVAILKEAAAEQKDLLTNFGPANPVVSVAQYANTLRKILQLRGFPNMDEFFNVVPVNWQPPQTPPQPSPEQVMAQANLQMEQMKSERELAIKKDELRLKEKQMDIDTALRIRQMAVDASLKRYAIDAQFHADFTSANLDRDAADEQAHVEATIKAHDMLAENALDAQGQLHDQALAVQGQAHDQQMAEEAAEAAPAGGGEGE